MKDDELAAQLQVTGPGFHLGYGVLLQDTPEAREAIRKEARDFFERLQKFAVSYCNDE